MQNSFLHLSDEQTDSVFHIEDTSAPRTPTTTFAISLCNGNGQVQYYLTSSSTCFRSSLLNVQRPTHSSGAGYRSPARKNPSGRTIFRCPLHRRECWDLWSRRQLVLELSKPRPDGVVLSIGVRTASPQTMFDCHLIAQAWLSLYLFGL